MYQRIRQLVLSGWTLALMLGCTGSNFAGDPARKGAGPGGENPGGIDSKVDEQNNMRSNQSTLPDSSGTSGLGNPVTGTGTNGPTGNIGTGSAGGEGQGIITGNDSLHSPKKCTVTNSKFTPSQGASCPAHYAAFTADDGRSPHFGCCPLPARDILTKDPPQTRGGQCGADEVVTGVSGGNVICRRINSQRYRLGPAQTTCYVGSGVAGGSGAAGCGVPPVTLQALVAIFGSDACIGVPFGALIVGRTGSNCTDVTAAQLLYSDTGKPVKMYD